MTSAMGRTIAALVLVWVGGSAGGATLYEQSPEQADGAPAFFNGTLGLALLDDFTVNDSGSVSEIVWWGGFAGDDAPATTGYALTLYSAADSGAPGDALYRYEIVFSGDAGINTGLIGTPGLGDFQVFEYHAVLSQQWDLTAGTQYFLGIQELYSANSLWLTASTMGNGRYAVGSDTACALQTGWDFAFSLRGARPDSPGDPNPVPVPAAGGLAAAGAAGVALARGLRRGRSRIR